MKIFCSFILKNITFCVCRTALKQVEGSVYCVHSALCVEMRLIRRYLVPCPWTHYRQGKTESGLFTIGLLWEWLLLSNKLL